MAFRMEMKDVFNCSATDEEGFRCALRPNHSGPHRWGRCQYVDAGGHRCFLPPRHPGDHSMPWFDQATPVGARHVVRYQGTEDECRARAAEEARIFRAHGWAPLEPGFKLGLPWRWRPIAALMNALLAPRGQLDVAYEYRPSEEDGEPSDEP